MCMADSADPCEVFETCWYTARKQHRCGECGRTIEPRERYEKTFVVFEGDASSHKTCGHCVEARRWLLRECHGYVVGEVETDLREHWEEARHVKAYLTRELARIVYGLRVQWTRRDGTVMALPKVRDVEVEA